MQVSVLVGRCRILKEPSGGGGYVRSHIPQDRPCHHSTPYEEESEILGSVG